MYVIHVTMYIDETRHNPGFMTTEHWAIFYT